MFCVFHRLPAIEWMKKEEICAGVFLDFVFFSLHHHHRSIFLLSSYTRLCCIWRYRYDVCTTMNATYTRRRLYVFLVFFVLVSFALQKEFFFKMKLWLMTRIFLFRLIRRWKIGRIRCGVVYKPNLNFWNVNMFFLFKLSITCLSIRFYF